MLRLNIFFDGERASSRADFAARSLPSSIYDLKSPADGVVVSVPQSKTDQESAGREVGLSFGTSQDTCPVRSLRQWLAASGIPDGPVFRSVGRYGHVAQRGLHRDSIEKLLKRAAARAGMNVKPLGGHSLRAGCVASTSWESVASTIPTTREDIGRSVQTRKCENCWTRRLWSKMGTVRSAMKNSPTTATSYPITSIPAAWAPPGGTTIRETFRRSTGGATGRRDRPEDDLWPVR